MKTFKKIFNNENPNWDNNSEYNKMFLQTQLYYTNNFYKKIGDILLLKDLYRILGIPITKESCTHGWYKGVLKEEDYVKFSFSQIEGTSDFELIFECYPILNYLPEEESEA